MLEVGCFYSNYKRVSKTKPGYAILNEYHYVDKYRLVACVTTEVQTEKGITNYIVQRTHEICYSNTEIIIKHNGNITYTIATGTRDEILADNNRVIGYENIELFYMLQSLVVHTTASSIAAINAKIKLWKNLQFELQFEGTFDVKSL